MAKYLVHETPGRHIVTISLDGFGPTKTSGEVELGSFEFDAEGVDAQVSDPTDINRNGDHPFVAEARKILREKLGDGANAEAQLRQYTFFDKASNAEQIDYEQVSDGDLSTDALPTLDADMDPKAEGPGGHSEASTQAGGVQSSVTGEHRPATQVAGEKATTVPATKTVQPKVSTADSGKVEGENK